MKRWKLLALLGLFMVAVGGGVVGTYAWLLQGQHPTKERLFRTPTGKRPYYGRIQYRAKDARPAIMKPEFVTADKAKIAAGTMGIGVSINGESRFYPLFILQYHQVVNDKCGGKCIVCSY